MIGQFILEVTFFIRLGPLRWVPTVHCAGRRGLNLLTAVRPVELAHWRYMDRIQMQIHNLLLLIREQAWTHIMTAALVVLIISTTFWHRELISIRKEARCFGSPLNLAYLFVAFNFDCGFIYLFIYLSIFLFIYLSIYLSIYSFIYYLFIIYDQHYSLFIYFFIFIYLFICLFIYYLFISGSGIVVESLSIYHYLIIHYLSSFIIIHLFMYCVS